ncbi:uncharacterized protein LOC141711303 [Apium graveolens]|uniref:uncharacterized protein LOC141711303 n=1 Tax=Apium graveolens TaxID=4045 RepID=UPI003D78F0F1
MHSCNMLWFPGLIMQARRNLCLFSQGFKIFSSFAPPLQLKQMVMQETKDGELIIILLPRNSRITAKDFRGRLKQWPYSYEFRLRVSLSSCGNLNMISRIRNIDSSL